MESKKEYLCASVADTESAAADIASYVKKGDYIALFGEMGAGKTAFTRGLVKALAPECLPLVHSPTFATVNEYIGEKLKIYHFDLYRITDEDDLYSIGFYDCIGGENIVISEWSELFEDEIPQNALRVTIKRGSGDEDRIIEFVYDDEREVG